MTFHRYDPETCGGHHHRRDVTRSVLAGFVFGLGICGGAIWLGSAAGSGTLPLARTAAPFEQTARVDHGHPVRHAEFVRETPAPR